MCRKTVRYLSRYLLPALFLLLLSCGQKQNRQSQAVSDSTIVFKHFKLANARRQFQKAIAEFERQNPGLHVREEILPSNSNIQHQFYVTSLESHSADFDVFLIDVIWTPEFSLAGWLEDVSDLFPDSVRSQFFPAPIKADTYQGRLFAIPWYIDAGVLYYRKDLLQKYGFTPPATYDQLVRQAQTIVQGENQKNLNGFLWQGKQYEGLICVANEIISGFGGTILDDSGRVCLQDAPVRQALQWLKDTIYRYRISPRWTLSADEENTRLSFLNGNAVFLRNWPYCWTFFQRKGSPVKGKVGVIGMPSISGKQGRSTLGGWQLAVNRFSRKKAIAKKFVRFLSSAKMQLEFALTVGTKPSRRNLYRNRQLQMQQPFIADLYRILIQAKPRPVTPFYAQISQILQIEFSAVLANIRPIPNAMHSASVQIEHILQLEQGTK